jgi:replicative DNA helicase
VGKDFVYDPGNEALVLRAAISLAQDQEQRIKYRALVHAIGADEFLVGQHCSLWRALRRVADGNLDYTPETFRQLLSLEASPVGDDYLIELESSAEIAPNLDFHVQTLRWDATRARVMKGALPDLVGDLTDPKVPIDRAVASARAVVRALEGGSGRRYIHRQEELAVEYSAMLRQRQTQGNFFPTGFEAVDEHLSEGFAPGNTAIITGLSGSGKSTFAAKLAINMAKIGRKPLVCAWEMKAYSTLDLMVAMLTRIPLETIIKGKYSSDELARLDRANEWINKRIRFMENAFFGQVATRTDGRKERRSNDRNLDILEGYIAESGCDEVIMDLWDRLLADQSPDGVTDALYRQQAMHAEYNVHGTLLVQLRLKDVERRADKRPTRESIKGVGTFVEVADLIFGIHRDGQSKDVPDDTIECICLKQRKGRLNWAIRFGWDGATCQIHGGEQVPYNPGLEAAAEYGELAEPSAIRTKPRRSKINNRD